MSRLVVGDGCWEWSGARKPPQGPARSGYGIIRRGGKLVGAHRVAYELFHGPIAQGLVVMHTCDNPCCCRPDHLKVAAQGENMRDRDQKGRQRGKRNPLKLTAASAARIRLSAASGRSQHSLAREYGVSQPLVSYIVRGMLWRPPA